jgi:hypothetical protein
VGVPKIVISSEGKKRGKKKKKKKEKKIFEDAQQLIAVPRSREERFPSGHF